MSKGSAQRPHDKDKFNEAFDNIFGVTCKRCGKTRLQPDSVHTCTPKEIMEKADEGKQID